jgi:multidrug efflux pump
VQLATPRLPDEVRRNGVQVAKRSTNFLLVVALNSPDNSRDTLFLSNYGTQNVLDELKRVPGRGRRLHLRRARLQHAPVAEARPHGAL